MTVPVPHPDRAAVDAGAQAFLDAVAKMRKIPAEERPKLADLDPAAKVHARTWALDILGPAAPALARQLVRVLAADLDAVGELSAATRLHMVADSWDATWTVPDDLSGLL